MHFLSYPLPCSQQVQVVAKWKHGVGIWGNILGSTLIYYMGTLVPGCGTSFETFAGVNGTQGFINDQFMTKSFNGYSTQPVE